MSLISSHTSVNSPFIKLSSTKSSEFATVFLPGPQLKHEGLEDGSSLGQHLPSNQFHVTAIYLLYWSLLELQEQQINLTPICFCFANYPLNHHFPRHLPDTAPPKYPHICNSSLISPSTNPGFPKAAISRA